MASPYPRRHAPMLSFSTRLANLLRSVGTPAARHRCFENILVHPTYALLRPPLMLFRGGPAWPRFWLQGAIRHCRYKIALPLDQKPRAPSSAVEKQEPVGIWCGPVSEHFGHAITDFGGRLAWSSQFRPDVPLIFSALPGGRTPPPFFFQMMAHFGVKPERIMIVSSPTRYSRLYVFPQAERQCGTPPDPAYLALLDQIVSVASSPSDGSRLFVSRAGLPKGRIAGEDYLENTLAKAGFEIFRPELFSLEEQMLRYRKADHLLFSEGSAIHALQLLGSLPAKVTVICRRRGSRIAEQAIRARVRSIDYIDCVDGLIHGARSGGGPQRSSGMSVLDPDICVSGFAKAGIDIEAVWDREAYIACRDRDVAEWIKYRQQWRHSLPERLFIHWTSARAGVSLNA